MATAPSKEPRLGRCRSGRLTLMRCDRVPQAAAVTDINSDSGAASRLPVFGSPQMGQACT
jgi:hypothetical protein